ncbi:hypothetical protein [Actinocorallia sp. A-T 12471]|uniref:hypothetical protein n=1 Tax=Actinocorallia sp. A-T 12471 TaxID=3089813 RepID=UPI0029D06BDF|nr:hypothetical protein [Actinocorallia sp. A-T 12471]MDX6738288.1 hypothetical protein [Actinocorallia sp. A-T 12471]
MSEATDTARPVDDAVADAPAETIEEIDGQLSLADAEPEPAEPAEAKAEDADEIDADEPAEDDDAKAEPSAKTKTKAKPETEDAEDAEDSEESGEADAEADGDADADDAVAAKAVEKKRKKAVRPTQKPVRASPGPGVPLWVLGVLGALVVALGVSTAWLWSSGRTALTQDEIDKAVRTAAASAQHISSWDYRTIEQDIDQVLGETTGDFHKAYEASAAKLLQTAPEQEAVTVGMTSKAGVEAVKDDGSVTVLVFLNQQTTSKDAEAHIEQHRLRLTMVDRDGRWLVSKLEVLG